MSGNDSGSGKEIVRDETFGLTIVVLFAIGILLLALRAGLFDPLFTWLHTWAVVLLAAIAAVVGVFTYRYTVRQNIRGALSELEPLVLEGNYLIKPVLFDLRWRPGVFSRVRREPIYPQTTLKFLIYKVGDNQNPGEFKQFCERELGIPPEDFKNDIQESLDLTDVAVDVEIISQAGLRISCDTTNGRNILRIADQVLRRIHRVYYVYN